MKKMLTLLLAVVVLAAMIVPASAASEEQLIEKFKEISISKRLITEVENLAAAYDVTEEQGDKLMVLIERAKEVLPEDKGPGYANPEGHESYFGPEKYPYTEEQLEEVLDIISEACDIMGFTYDFVPSENPMHKNDIVFVLKDAEGRLAFQYDGDLIKPLGEVEEETAKKPSSAPFVYGGISVFALAGLSVAAVKSKKKEQE